MNLFFVQVEVANLPTSLGWYAEILGLGLLLEDGPNGFAMLDGGSTKIALRQSGGARDGRGVVTLTFEVRDVEAERARLIGLGVEVAEPVEVATEGYRVIRLTDPDGTPIRLFSWTRKDYPGWRK